MRTALRPAAVRMKLGLHGAISMKNSTFRLGVSVFFFLLSVVWLIHCYSLPFTTPITLIGGPGTFPFLVLSGMTIGFCVLVVQEYRKMRRGDDTGETDPASCRRVLGLLAVGFAYVLLFIPYLGYLLATALLLLPALLIFGERDKRVLVAVPVLFPVALWLLFKHMLMVPLP